MKKKVRRSLTRRKSQYGLEITRMNLLRVRFEMYEVKKHDGETSVKIKFAGERFTFSFVTEIPYEEVVEMLEVGIIDVQEENIGSVLYL